MRKQQLIDAKRGTNLLLGHLKGAGERLNTAMENEDKQALIDSADALVTVAVILIRMLRDRRVEQLTALFLPCDLIPTQSSCRSNS